MFDMAQYESYFDQEYAMYQMPDEYKDTKIIVMCNDCMTKSVVKFHVFGAKCFKCRSYNTSRIEDDKNLK